MKTEQELREQYGWNVTIQPAKPYLAPSNKPVRNSATYPEVPPPPRRMKIQAYRTYLGR